MSQMKNNRLLTAIPIRDAMQSQQVELDLALVTEQLLAIARELRRTDYANSAEAGSGNPGSSGETGSPSPLELAPRPDRRTKSRQCEKSPVGVSSPMDNRQGYLDHARSAYSNRRSRTAIFGNAELFGEPAWDILLDLYIAYVEGKPVSVSSACIGSDAPPTTGLRWLGVLAENDLVLREHDPQDQRRVLVRLTETGLAAMDEYFTRAGTAP